MDDRDDSSIPKHSTPIGLSIVSRSSFFPHLQVAMNQELADLVSVERGQRDRRRPKRRPINNCILVLLVLMPPPLNNVMSLAWHSLLWKVKRSPRHWVAGFSAVSHHSMKRPSTRVSVFKDNDLDDYYESLQQHGYTNDTDLYDTAASPRKDFYVESEDICEPVDPRYLQEEGDRPSSSGNPFPFPQPDFDFFADKKRQLQEQRVTPDTSSPTSNTPFSSVMQDPVAMSPFLDATTIPSPSDLPLKSLKVPELQHTNRIEDTIASLQEQLVRIEKEIYIMNDGGKKFNLNSPKQVSLILFGRPDLSTNKATLEGMAANNIMAKLILEYRITKQQLQKLNKKQQLYKHTQTTNTPLHNDHDPLWLIDTSSFIFRAYYSMPPLHRSPDGMPIGAVMGFCNMLNKLVWNDMFRRTHQHTKRIVLCLDAPTAEHAEARTFRHELYPDYKAHRPSLPLDLIPQFDLVQKAAKAYGIVQIQAQGYEADDVMATLSTKACRDEQLHVRILSGDKDLMQLITEDDDHSSERGSIHMIDPMTMTPWTAATVVEKWGVPAHQLGDVLALAGDTADNVPGVPGIGPKIAAQLLQEYQTLDNLLARTDEIKQKGRREKLETYKNQALLSRDLVELVCDLEWSQMEVFYPNEDTPVILENDTDDEEAQDDPIKVGDLRLQTIDPDRLLAFYDEMGFYTMKQRFLEKLKQYEALHGSLGGTGTSFSSAEEAKPKKKSKWTPRKKMGIPKPEDYKDVPF